MHFGEYELSPSLIGLSPLPTGHPKGFQRLLFGTSILGDYPNFSLPWVDHSVFASTPTSLSPCSDSLSLRLRA